MMKRKRWILLGTIVLLVLLAVAGVWRKHEPIARIPLPDGTELRLEYVTYGTQHKIPGAGNLGEWASRVASRWPSLGISYQVAEYTQQNEKACPVLWFTHFEPKTGKYLPVPGRLKVESVLAPNWQLVLPGNGQGAWPLPNTSYEVSCYDRRQKDFRVRVTLQGQTAELVVANPVAGQKFPEWKPDPEPLPRTVPIAGGELTLRSLRLQRNGSSSWYVIFENSFLVNGKKLPGVLIDWALSDATGNLARGSPLPLQEPAWKVRATVRRSGDFPFAADEGVTLGPVKFPGPGVCSEFVVPPVEREKGLRFAAFFGPGHYIVQGGKLTLAEATGGQPGSRGTSMDSMQGARHEFTVQEPELVLLFEGRATDYWSDKVQRIAVRLQAPDVALGLSSTGLSGGSDGDMRRTRAHFSRNGEKPIGASVRAGDAISVQIVPSQEESVEFLVAPPKLSDQR